jgi:hypothetical protein
LNGVPALIYHARIERDRIEAAIIAAPAWAKIRLAMPNQKMQAQSARELAACIVDSLNHPPMEIDQNQLALPL